MSSCIAYRQFATDQRRRPSRTKSFQSKLGAAGIASLVLACAWTVYSNIFAASIYPSVSANYEPVLRAKLISFAERFEPAASTPLKPGKSPNRYVALLDPTYSLGFPSSRFSAGGLEEAPPQIEAAASVPASPPSVAPAPAPIKLASASAPTPSPRPAPSRASGPTQKEIAQASKAMVAAAQASKPSIFERLFGKPKENTVLAFAGPDGGIGSDGQDAPAKSSGLYDRMTAVYDISARTVYLPDGTKLEAHSGLGSRLDDPRFVHEKMRGATPPHVYDLKPREALFHGVAALRLNPVGGESAIFGRAGLLAHTYMLGPNGDSNGCISFKDYNKFLQAYRNGEVKRLVVVASLD
jgi:hypothetical protein